MYGEREVDELGSKRQEIGDRPRKEARGRREEDSIYTPETITPYPNSQVLYSEKTKLRVERLLGGVNGFCGFDGDHGKGTSTPSWLLVGACHWPKGAVGDVQEGCREARIETVLHKDSANFEDTVGRIDFALDGDGPKMASSQPKQAAVRNPNSKADPRLGILPSSGPFLARSQSRTT